MSATRTENTKVVTESFVNLQPFALLFVVIVAGLLIAIPLLPAWVNNLNYSFTGANPMIYWYLSRAAGFVALSILWLSMALGLSITNKIARVWPGTSTAFSLHEYVSLLGLTFALYHGLVLMGDHFVDFSLPRLMMPFSIAYLPFWTGLGQLAFYIWVFVALSFYIRQRIGQKTWRKIHYLNFAMYMMGLFHGAFGGTDSTLTWAKTYYWVSGLSLLGLLAYRIYTTVAPKKAASPKPVAQETQPVPQTSIPASIPRITAKDQVQPAESASTLETPVPVDKQEPAPVSVQAVVEETAISTTDQQEAVSTPKKIMTEPQETKPVDTPILPGITVKAQLLPTTPAHPSSEKTSTDQEAAVSKMILQIKRSMQLDRPPSPWNKKIFNRGQYKDILGPEPMETEKVSISKDK